MGKGFCLLALALMVFLLGGLGQNVIAATSSAPNEDSCKGLEEKACFQNSKTCDLVFEISRKVWYNPFTWFAKAEFVFCTQKGGLSEQELSEGLGVMGSGDNFISEIGIDCEESAKITYYLDSDGDGFGNSASFVFLCDIPIGYVTDKTDCNDTDADISPGEVEVLGDGIDNDCNVLTGDENFTKIAPPEINNNTDKGNELKNLKWESLFLLEQPIGLSGFGQSCYDWLSQNGGLFNTTVGVRLYTENVAVEGIKNTQENYLTQCAYVSSNGDCEVRLHNQELLTWRPVETCERRDDAGVLIEIIRTYILNNKPIGESYIENADYLGSPFVSLSVADGLPGETCEEWLDGNNIFYTKIDSQSYFNINTEAASLTSEEDYCVYVSGDLCITQKKSVNAYSNYYPSTYCRDLDVNNDIENQRILRVGYDIDVYNSYLWEDLPSRIGEGNWGESCYDWLDRNGFVDYEVRLRMGSNTNSPTICAYKLKDANGVESCLYGGAVGKFKDLNDAVFDMKPVRSCKTSHIMIKTQVAIDF